MGKETTSAGQGAVLLTVNLRGTPQELDRKLGRLVYTGNYLLERELNFEIRAATGLGLQAAYVDSREGLTGAIDALLCAPLAPQEESWAGADAGWHYHMGGEADDS